MAATWLAIINPRAGFPRPRSWQGTMESRLSGELGAQVVFTEGRGHATQLASSSRADSLAVFGGDGTLAEVVNGMDLSRQRLLPLAGGTGNGLARDLGLTSIERSFAAARAGRVQSLDLIRVEWEGAAGAGSRLAISTASVGYAARVVALANAYFKRLGPWCYPLASTIQAARQTRFPATLALDGGSPESRQVSNVMINNTRHAGNFRAFRAAQAADGKMEVLIATAGFWHQLLHNLAVLTGTYFYATAPERSARSLVVEMPDPQLLMIDGELWKGVSRAHFEILPGRLQCLA